MRIRRAVSAAVLGLAAGALLALPAAAAAPGPYPPNASPGALGTSSSTVEVGGSVTVTGGGFAPNSTVTITITVAPAGFARVGPAGFARVVSAGSAEAATIGPLLAGGTLRAVPVPVQGFAAQSATTNAGGSFTASVTFTRVGANTITATGVDPSGRTRTLSAVVYVTAASSGPGNGGSPGGGSLPNTGSDLRLPLLLGGVLVLLGGGAVVVGRRAK